MQGIKLGVSRLRNHVCKPPMHEPKLYVGGDGATIDYDFNFKFRSLISGFLVCILHGRNGLFRPRYKTSKFDLYWSKASLCNLATHFQSQGTVFRFFQTKVIAFFFGHVCWQSVQISHQVLPRQNRQQRFEIGLAVGVNAAWQQEQLLGADFMWQSLV